MKLSLSIEAFQLKNGDSEIAGQPVKNFQDEPIFAIVPVGNTHLRVDEDMWLVIFPDGSKEVWNTSKILKDTNYTMPVSEVENTEAEPLSDDNDL